MSDMRRTSSRCSAARLWRGRSWRARSRGRSLPIWATSGSDQRTRSTRPETACAKVCAISAMSRDAIIFWKSAMPSHSRIDSLASSPNCSSSKSLCSYRLAFK